MLHSQQETHCGEQRVRPCQAWHVHWINGVCVCVSEGVQPQNVYKLQEAKKKKKTKMHRARSKTNIYLNTWWEAEQ